MCMADGCKRHAVATWSSNLQPNKPWHCCEKCQEEDFGGWPLDHESPQKTDDDKKSVENSTKKNDNVVSEEKLSVDEASNRKYSKIETNVKDPSISSDTSPSSPKKEFFDDIVENNKEDIIKKEKQEEGKSIEDRISHASDYLHEKPILMPSKKNTFSVEIASKNGDGEERIDTSKSKRDDEPLSSEKSPQRVVQGGDCGNKEDCSEKKEVEECKERVTVVESKTVVATPTTDSKDVNANVNIGELEFEPFLTDEDDAVINRQDKKKDEESKSESIGSITSKNETASGGKGSSNGLEIKKEGDNAQNNDQTSAEQDQDEDVEDNAEEEDEVWDLKMVLTASDISQKNPIMCSTDNCPLVACGAWVSNLKPSDPWYTCLDCQEMDFGGWPDELWELPIKTMSQMHKDTITKHCTRLESPSMPDLPEPKPSSPSKNIATAIEASKYHTVTPPPSKGVGKTAGKSSSITAHAKNDKQKTMVTPSPAPLPRPAQPSAAALAMHRKWQAEAEKLGGPNVRIVVNKLEAKKLIFDTLHESFRPMNITEIYKVKITQLKDCMAENTFVSFSQ